jgi:predicted pyridoxine 5'-phosphate oxidase superfamily flavin-nucleotide-binding protein
MRSPYHPGELAVQARAGVLVRAARVGGIIGSTLPPQAGAFLTGQRLAVVGAADAAGRVWASMLTGDRGMLNAADARTLRIAASLGADDPLARTLTVGAVGATIDIGVLAIDLASRRRLRINGAAEMATDGRILVHVRQAYWICPKYIQRRVLVADAAGGTRRADDGASSGSHVLDDTQRTWVAGADTFFIASVHPADGADASHRGGSPGFVRLTRGTAGEDVLEFPDYPGNNMFNTFGNLAVNPVAGLLFVDFERSATLQLTGAAEVLWDPARFADFPGAERAVRFHVAEVLERRDDSPLRWRLVERSPFNPPARRRAHAP